MCEVRTPEGISNNCCYGYEFIITISGEVYPQRRGSFTLSRPFKKESKKRSTEETAAPLMNSTQDSGQSMTTPM